MDRKQVIVAALLGALVLAVFFLGVAISGDKGEDADTDDVGGVKFLDGLIARIPGIGQELDAVDVSAPCLVDGVLVLVDGLETCSFAIADGIDRGALRYVSGGCTVRITGQEDTFDQRIRPGDANDDGVIRLGLDGSGAIVTLQQGPCEMVVD